MNKVDEYLSKVDAVKPIRFMSTVGNLKFKFSVDTRGGLRIETETIGLGVGLEIRNNVNLPREAVASLFDWLHDTYGLQVQNRKDFCSR